MKRLCAYWVLGMLLCAAILTPRLVWAQAATTGTVIGQVTDQSAASVPGATVVLTDLSTKAAYGEITNRDGRFVFSEVKPGVYDVTVTAKGFRKLTVASQDVVVGQSVSLSLTLEVGATTQSVEVTAVAGAELQTLNSTVGTTLGGNTILSLPNQNRDATTLLLYQPMVAPTFGGVQSNETGGQVAGAISDQTTFTLDGGNATDDMAGDNNYIASARGYVGPQAAIPTPVESIEEFKVATNNQTADFSTSSGGQVMLVTKRGTNTWHGSVYDYFQANWLNAAGWDTDSTYGETVHPVKQHQNRFGGAIGGPVIPSHWGGKTYFYGNYEGRRFPAYVNARYEKLVPSALLREGVIQEPNSAGTWMEYPLETSTLCGSGADLPCDPRAGVFGTAPLNPTIQKLWSQYMPMPNDCPGDGDHYNTCGYFAPLTLPGRDDFVVGRLDHDFGSKWRAYGTYRWYSLKDPTTNQVDIGGLLPGDTLGVPASQSSNPDNPRYSTVGLAATITPSITNEFHVSMLRNDWNYVRAGVPVGQLGFAAGLEVGGETTTPLAPMNFDTQDARNRLWDGQDWTWSDSVNWVRGTHFVQMGGQYMHFYDIHERDDEVTAALTQLVYQIGNANSDLLWNTNLYPQLCGTGSTSSTVCMASSSESSYENFAAELMGIVNQDEQVFVRGGTNFALTGASYLEDHSTIDAYNLYFTDSWKLRPNLTVNYGVEWGVTMPPYEKNGIQDILTDSQGNPLSFNGLVAGEEAAALKGLVSNPILGDTPILAMGNHEKYPYAPWYGGFSPRVSLAYSPKGSRLEILNKILGDKKTVFRGGYGRIFDRLNSVNLVLTPLLGYGFGQPVRGIGANMNDTISGVTDSVTIANAFRIGTDGGGGAAPFPVITQTLPVPAEPGVNSPGATSITSLDSNMRPGVDDQVDFTIQRELPGGVLLEAGWNGRWANHIPLDEDTDAVPVMLTLGGQTFSSAYYNIFLADQAGATTVAAQPWFETALGGPTSAFCTGYANCSTAFMAREGHKGTLNITKYNPYQAFSDLDTNAYHLGANASLWNWGNCVGCQILPSSLGHYGYNNNQGAYGFSNYQALFLTAQKRTGHGLTLSANYTYSHTLNTLGINQEYTNYSTNYIWNLHADYVPALFDRTQFINILAHYELPFGRGKYFASSNPLLDRVIGGWTFSPVFTWGTGLPLETETDVGGEFGGNTSTSEDVGEVALVNTSAFGHTAQINYHVSPTTATYPGASQGNLVGYANDPYADCAGKVCAPHTYGVNLFKNPAAVFNSYRPSLLGLDTYGNMFGPYYGQHRWDLDFTLAKQTLIKERWNVTIYAQFLNSLNHMEYSDPTLEYLSPSTWGDLTGQYNNPRVIELGMRLAF